MAVLVITSLEPVTRSGNSRSVVVPVAAQNPGNGCTVIIRAGRLVTAGVTGVS